MSSRLIIRNNKPILKKRYEQEKGEQDAQRYFKI